MRRAAAPATMVSDRATRPDKERDMETTEFLTREREAIVMAAGAALTRTRNRRYETAGPDENHRRLDALFGSLLLALDTRDLEPVLAFAQQIAAERFSAGYDLSEVQVAFNTLEEATWSRVFAELEPAQFAEMLGLVSTILGAAKDALARAYVSLATNAHAPSLDLQILFAGTERR
jgi:hypothetical protein